MAARGSTGAGRAASALSLLLVQLVSGAIILRQPFRLEESISGDFSALDFDAVWINGTALLYEKDGEVVVTDVSTNTTDVLLPQEVFAQFEPKAHLLSADERFLLLGYDLEEEFRHSASARYVAYNIAENTTTKIARGRRLQLADWSVVDSALVYVYKNNLYYMPEPGAKAVQITHDGEPGFIYNGVADELNDVLSAEDSLGKDAALWWSPDGAKLAFAQYDDTLVHNSSFLLYGTPGDLENQYETVVTFHYAKVGTPKPKVKLLIATLPTPDSSTVEIKELMPPADVVGKESDISDVTWVTENILLIAWTNRISTINQFVTYYTDDEGEYLQGVKGMIFKQKDGWLDAQSSLFKTGNTTTFVTIAWEAQTGNDSFPQIVAVTGNWKQALTFGRTTVTEIYGWADNGTLYYQATEEEQPSRRQVFAVEERGTPRCLSCDVTSPEGQKCLRASASFSADLSWYALTCSGPDPPITSMRSSANPRESVQVLEDNAEVRQKLSRKLWPQQLDDWVDVGEGLRAQVRMLLPPGLDPATAEKTPTIVYVYAGPSSQQIDDTFSVDFHSYIVTSRRYVYVLIDGRGSDCKGGRTLFAVYRRLGSAEVLDQISVTRRLQEKYPFIDEKRTAIWGWSYGGYVTAMALAQDYEDVFQCGASVAPVSSWIYYDAAYTERYMGLPTPEDNEGGYIAGDVTQRARNLDGKQFFLLHGTGDANVHYQHSMMLARALEGAGVLFRQQSYPDQDHGISELSEHLYQSLDEFFVECFSKPSTSVSSALKISGGVLAVGSVANNVL